MIPLELMLYVQCSLDANCQTEIFPSCLSQNLVTSDSCISLACEHWLRMIGFMFNKLTFPAGRNGSFLD